MEASQMHGIQKDVSNEVECIPLVEGVTTDIVGRPNKRGISPIVELEMRIAGVCQSDSVGGPGDIEPALLK
jgi:hypothetical protein